MSTIMNKVQTITSLFKRKPTYSYGQKQNGIVHMSTEALTAFVEKYKGIRRTILAVVLWINIHNFLVTIEMYRLDHAVDMQWVIFTGLWTAMLATFVGFYTVSRTAEYNSETGYSRPGEWMHDKREKPTSSYSVSEYTEDDDPSFYNDSVPVDTEEIDGDSLVEENLNG